MEYALKARYIVSFHYNQPTIIENGAILVDEGVITAIGKDLDVSQREVVNLDQHVIMPGMINSHTHAAMTLFRGYADDVPLDKWLNEYIWPLEAKLTAEQVEIGAKVAAIEAIRSGTTALNSMYWHPDSEIQAFRDLGVRLMVGPPIISGVSSLQDFEYLVDKWHGEEDDLIRITLNPHAPYTVIPEDYQEMVEYKNTYNATSDNPPLKIHTHLAEGRGEMDLIRNFAKERGFSISPQATTPAKYLDSFGVLDQDTIVAHAVECQNEDFELLAKREVGIATNTVSNMKLGNNVPKISKMLQYSNKVGIGTDGPASNNGLNMFEAMKITALTQKNMTLDPAIIGANTILRMATLGSAKVLGWDGLGILSEGSKADLVAIDLQQPHLRPITSPTSVISHLVYSVRGEDVSDVMINGKWRMRKHTMVDIDLIAILDQFDSAVQDLIASV